MTRSITIKMGDKVVVTLHAQNTPKGRTVSFKDEGGTREETVNALVHALVGLIDLRGEKDVVLNIQPDSLLGN